MLTLDRDADRVVVRASGFSLVCERQTDRWSHRFEVNQWTLFSVEGNDSDMVPPSPAFQDLWVEVQGDASIELQLMGQAGQAIFSAAIRVQPDGEQVTLDLCARRKRAGAEICTGSLYEFRSNGAATDPHASGQSSLPDASQILQPLPLSPNVSFPISCGIQSAGRQIKVAAPIAVKSGRPANESVRWRYEFRLPTG